eukprot:TRINITY_DN1563_c0_g1_i1.p1 TRINITY_DN1563_c0_g1~~TRINITY_DN1563_c0_g1_i1.p1  ORF type:complete len:178 (-),score=27.97 TRINITY_DN1563_c0_g1_i1:125-658(-)
MEVGLNYWVQVVINESMMHVIDITIAKSLSLVSHSITNTVKRFIESNFYFSLLPDRRFTFYQPKNIQFVTSIEQINASIQKVRFAFYFNECIDLSKFTNITHVQFEDYFDCPIENMLPPNLTSLFLGTDFNHPIPTLPPSVKVVRFNTNNSRPKFKHSISHLNPKIKFQISYQYKGK